MAAKIRRLGTLAREVAPDVRDNLEAFIATSLASGTTPGGDALRPTKDGRRPLVNAASAITVKVVGTIVTATVTGVPELFHNKGTKRLGAPRRLVPSSGTIPPAVADAIREALRRRVEELSR